MTLSFAYLSLGLLFWCIAGFWMASSEWVYRRTAHWEPRRLWDVVIYGLAGPLWWLLDLIVHLVNRPRDDRE